MSECVRNGKSNNHNCDEFNGLLSKLEERRGCTDIVFCLIFAIFCSGMVLIAVFSLTKGDAFRLVYGTDSYGNTCDEDNSARVIPAVPFSGENLKGRPYIFFMDITDPEHSHVICVNQCPERRLNSREDLFHFSEQTGSLLCRYDLKPSHYFYVNNSKLGPCPTLPVYESKPLLNRCIPMAIRSFPRWISNNIIAFLNKSDVLQKVLGDLYASWQEMVGLFFISLGFTLLAVLLIRCLTSIIVWIIVVAVVISGVMLTAVLWWTYLGYKYSLDSQEHLQIPLLELDINSEHAFLVFSVVASFLLIILLVLLLTMLRRVSLIVVLLFEANQCIASVPMLSYLPAISFFLLFVFIIYWIIVLAYLSTAARPTVHQFGFVQYTEHRLVSYFWWYHTIGLIWLSEYIIACQQFVVSSAIAQWYFARNKKNLGSPILKAIGRLILYHQGSVAIGAILIPLIKVPRMLILYLNKQIRVSNNCCTKFCSKCCFCCLSFADKCLKYIDTSSYAVIAMSGENFCSSSKKVVAMLESCTFRIAALDSVGDILILLAKMAITAFTCVISIVLFKSRTDLHFFAIPVLLACVFSYFVAHCFLSVFQMAINTLLLCFCEDSELNDGNLERPYFASKRLILFINDTSNLLNKASRRTTEGNVETEPTEV